MPPMDSPEIQAVKIRDRVVPAIRDGLVGVAGHEVGVEPGRPLAAAMTGEPAPRDPIFTGDLAAVQDYYEERLWTDGLPIIPPTVEAVEAFLAHTPRAPESVIGVLAPDYREATVWSIAVNGVMAGCRPEYMPILVAAVEAICDPEFRHQDGGATPGWEPMVVVSGPMVERLGFNTKSGLMRVGPRPNTSIGRFLRLYMRNVAGLRTPPGLTDKGLIGQTFHVAMAEDDFATRGLGWEPTRVERGFKADDDVVTVRSVYTVSLPIYTSGSAEEQLAVLAQVLGEAAGPWLFVAFYTGRSHPLLLLSPMVAAVMAEAGVTKAHIRNYLYEHARTTASWADDWCIAGGAGERWTLRSLIPRGELPPRYGQTYDPDRRVQVVLRPEWIDIVVAGDPMRNQSKFYINNQGLGAPVSRRVDFCPGTTGGCSARV